MPKNNAPKGNTQKNKPEAKHDGSSESNRPQANKQMDAKPGNAEIGAEPQVLEGDESGFFPIVGVGASAGGLEAISELLQALPANTGMGFVFIQHLDPEHVSLLTQLLQRQTSMPVQEVTDGTRVESNHVYVIPRNMDMTLLRGVLRLAPRATYDLPHMPIDLFLRSLAADLKSKAIGVILSGNASDGALGIMAIKAEGGITFAQKSDSAKFDSMPRSATASGCIDFVLAPKEIAAELARLGQHPYIAPAGRQTQADISPAMAEAVARILRLVRTATGVDFSYYKPNTLRRRILRRMALLRFDNLNDYLKRLHSDTSELSALYEDLLITVTEFFRDPEVFEELKKVVFPKIIPAKDSAGPIRVWVPGCSSGEEVYSIAIALLEFLGDRSNQVSIQIFGTDISETALEKARRAMYAPSLVEGISKERLRMFFTKVDSNYLINKRIREMCVFAKQNVVNDPPFSKIDLLSCRNLLIYLGPVLQERLVNTFHYALKPAGYLLLGAQETIRSPLFSATDKKNKIYRPVASAAHVLYKAAREQEVAADAQVVKEGWTEVDLAHEADRIVLGKYAPAGVIVDEHLNIIQFRGRTNDYLELPSGAATLNILKMARNGLARELRGALERCRREDKAVRKESIRVWRESGFFPVNIEVIPFRRLGRENRYLVLFEEPRSPKAAAPGKASKKRRSREVVEQELSMTKEYLQSIVEQHQASDEELRSANEEIQSGNEELQSTNEELETAKEELQSTNEELSTINEELQTSNSQLSRTGNDLLNLLSNVNFPIIMVGNDHRIRRFTPISEKLLNLIPTDVGRPIRDINLNLQIPDIDRLLSEVIETLNPRALNITDTAGRSYSLRIRPYRTEDNKIDGAVIVLVDMESMPATGGR